MIIISLEALCVVARHQHFQRIFVGG